MSEKKAQPKVKKPVKAKVKPKAKPKKKAPVKKSKKPASVKKATGTRLIPLNMKISKADKNAIEANARKFAKGNLSGWLRYAGKNYVPTKTDLVKI